MVLVYTYVINTVYKSIEGNLQTKKMKKKMQIIYFYTSDILPDR